MAGMVVRERARRAHNHAPYGAEKMLRLCRLLAEN